MVSSRHSDQSTNVDTPKHPASLQQVTKHNALPNTICQPRYYFVFFPSHKEISPIKGDCTECYCRFSPLFELKIAQALC